jgi:hypothetical protein
VSWAKALPRKNICETGTAFQYLTLVVSRDRRATKLHLGIGTTGRIKWAGDKIAKVHDEIRGGSPQMG